MTDQTIDSHKTPGIVIFVAILNFIGSFFMFLLAGICVLLLFFGNMAGLYDTVTNQIHQVYGQANLPIALNVLFGILLTAGLAFAGAYLLIGIGLLKGKKLAWYFQIALSVLGILVFPFGTVMNVIVLIFFFRQNTRTFFKV